MEPKKNTTPAPNTQKPVDNEHVAEAYQEAQNDIDHDADLSIHSENDDLDEGELARLGEDDNGVI